MPTIKFGTITRNSVSYALYSFYVNSIYTIVSLFSKFVSFFSFYNNNNTSIADATIGGHGSQTALYGGIEFVRTGSPIVAFVISSLTSKNISETEPVMSGHGSQITTLYGGIEFVNDNIGSLITGSVISKENSEGTLGGHGSQITTLYGGIEFVNNYIGSPNVSFENNKGRHGSQNLSTGVKSIEMNCLPNYNNGFIYTAAVTEETEPVMSGHGSQITTLYGGIEFVNDNIGSLITGSVSSDGQETVNNKGRHGSQNLSTGVKSIEMNCLPNGNNGFTYTADNEVRGGRQW